MIHTLLQLLSQPKRIGQRLLLSMPGALTPGSSPPVKLRHTYRNTLLGRICAATLHRLVVEDGVEVDSRSHLVPSLLTVVRQTDDELQQVRYECEKISIFSCNPIEDGLVGVTPPSTQGARGFTQVQTHLLPQPSDLLQQVSTSTSDATEDASSLFTEGRRAFDSCSVALLQAGHAVTQCVRQTYREQKWMVYVLKTILSSQAMIPQLEKKQMRVLGAPKLCFQDVTSNTVVAPPVPAPTNGSSSSRSTNSATHIDAGTIGEGALGGGYLLPVNMEKHVIRRVNGSEEIVPVSATAMDTSPRPKSAVTTRPIVSGIGSTRSSSANSNRTPTDASTIDQQGHARKFNRQMRLMRRNDRRDSSSLPPV